MAMKEGKSPIRGPFGGPDKGTLLELSHIAKQASGTIILSPIAHDPQHLDNCLLAFSACGFSVKKTELHYYRFVSDEFDDGISKGQKKCLRHDSRVVLVSDLSERLYSVISTNRESKGRKLSMSYEQVSAMQNATNGVVCFRLEDYSACAICIRVSPNVLYVWAWGDNGKGSPVVRLAKGIFDWCKSQEIKILDIGNALNEDGTENEGLRDFKLRLGFKPTVKVTISNV